MARMEELTAEEDTLHSRKTEILCELNNGGEIHLSFEAVRDLIARLGELLDKSSPSQKKTLLHLAIKEIIVGEGRKIQNIVLTISEKNQIAMNSEVPSTKVKVDGTFLIAI